MVGSSNPKLTNNTDAGPGKGGACVCCSKGTQLSAILLTVWTGLSSAQVWLFKIMKKPTQKKRSRLSWMRSKYGARNTSLLAHVTDPALVKHLAEKITREDYEAEDAEILRAKKKPVNTIYESERDDAAALKIIGQFELLDELHRKAGHHSVCSVFEATEKKNVVCLAEFHRGHYSGNGYAATLFKGPDRWDSCGLFVASAQMQNASINFTLTPHGSQV
jgi:hypothetical protein